MITIIGGGPAGLAAALAAGDSGSKVLLIDSAARLGGQYWRHLPENGAWGKQEAIRHDFEKGNQLRQRILQSPNIEVLSNAHVWRATSHSEYITLHILVGGIDRAIDAKNLILATGAYDRSLPFPGWDIPGVMTPGGAQALLKGNYVLAGKRIVVAGTGPFLLPVAAGLAEAGAQVVALLDANRWTRWLPRLHIALLNRAKLKEGAAYFQTLSKFKIRQQRGSAVIKAHAGPDGTLESVTIATIGRNFKARAQEVIRCDSLAVGWGFTADLSLASNLNLKQDVLDEDKSVFVTVDELQKTSMHNVFAAGEITGIGGSQLSLTEGKIAGFAVAAQLGFLTALQLEEKVRPLILQKKKDQKFASALISSYPVKVGWQEWLAPETCVCRCEEVTMGQIQESITELGATDARTVKLFTRTGMGMCQGRICGRAVIDIVASESRINPTIQDYISASSRPIVAPLPLGILAQGPHIE